MLYNLEEIDLTKLKSLYFLRGYKDKTDKNYCMVMALLGNKEDNYEVKLWLQDHAQKTLAIGDMKELVKYLQDKGMKLYADVLEEDFNRFWKSVKVKRVKITRDDNS